MGNIKIEYININKIKPNKDNPRTIKNEKFDKLCESLKKFPEMLNIRPIVINDKFEILGGNMRFRASKIIGLTEIPIIKVKNFTEEQEQEFMIKDNVSSGQWDYDMLGNEWDSLKLGDWGMDVWQPEKEVDLNVIDGFEMDDLVEEKEIKPFVKITFENVSHLKNEINNIEKIIERNENSFYSMNCEI